MLPSSLASPFYFLLLFCPDIQENCFGDLDTFPFSIPFMFLLVGTEILQMWPELVEPSLKSGSMQACTALLLVRPALQEEVCRGLLNIFVVIIIPAHY